MVFYRDNPSQAAYARKFLNLGPIAVNRGGHYRYFVWASTWGTTRPVDEPEQRDRLESIIVFADAEPLTFELSGWTPDAIGIGDPIYLKSVASAASAYYEVTIDQIRLIASAKDITVSTGPSRSDSYKTWDDQVSARENLRAFIDFVAH